jgi:hypothetical protein
MENAFLHLNDKFEINKLWVSLYVFVKKCDDITGNTNDDITPFDGIMNTVFLQRFDVFRCSICDPK